MKKLLLLAALVPLTTFADDVRPVRNAPPAFQAECASCHVAFPPALLVADDWKRVMAALDKHYGDNASLDAPTRKTLEDFLVSHAGNPRKIGVDKMASATELPRITRTAWFQREHREVRQADWKHEKVKSPANCGACHTQAAEGSYREREIVMPNGRRWED